MACACKVNQDLTYLRKKYGKEYPQQKRTNIRGMGRFIVSKVVTSAAVILLFPFMVGHVLLHRNRTVNIQKLFRINVKK